ncbi:bcl-2-related ovarian killer protein-like [Hyperolius riggenbachi]|uniref:bcl-2-related ovarian killer protein-like n=1 Tax=Hyperolius riggenbachi TaxID=752182 RepID=UPI0035A2F841
MAEARPTDIIVTEAYELSRDYIAYVTGRASGTAPTPTAHALRHAGDELLEKFPIFFKRWPRIFSGVTEDTACDLLIQTIDDNLMDFFERQKRQTGYQPDIPWSMVLSIYVLAGQMAIYCQEHGMEKALEPLAERVGRYVEENICPAIKKKDGWAGFTERYGKKANMEGKVLKMCSIVLVTLSALLLSYFLWKRRI